MLGSTEPSETLATVEIPDKPVKRVSAMQGTCVHNIKFMQEEQEITVFNRGSNGGGLTTRDIPPDHSIVGVYGTTYNNRIY